MRLKHLVVILLVSCGQDSMTAMSTMPTTYIMNSCSALYSISQAQTPKNYYCNQVQVVDDVREVSINQIAHTDKRVSKGEYSQMVQSQSDDPDNDRMRHIEINFTDKQQDPNVRHCGSFPIYILPNFFKSNY